MSLTLGATAISAMLESLDRDEQHATIAKFIIHELHAAQEKIALLHQQGSQQTDLLRELGAQQFELLRQQQSQTAAAGPTFTRRPEGLKIDISSSRQSRETP